MGNPKSQVRLIAALLMLAGLASIVWQHWQLDIPFTSEASQPVWAVDVQVKFEPKPDKPVKLEMFVPPGWGRYVTISESFIAKNYGINTDFTDFNRRAVWSARRVSGEQNLYYRLALTERTVVDALASVKGPEYAESPELSEVEKIAVDALVNPIRQHSADIETFISEAIKAVANTRDDNVKLLLKGDPSARARVRVLQLVLASAHIPIQQVHTIRLETMSSQTPSLWLRSYDGNKWLYFNPETGARGMPENMVVWWVGEEPVARVKGASNLKVTFSTSQQPVNSIDLSRSFINERDDHGGWALSMYELPLATQQVFGIIMMVPLGVMLILLLRNVVGIETLGTFTPVLIGLAFRETEVLWGVILFTFVSAMGMALRSYLENLHLQLLSRLSVVLTFVVLAMLGIAILGQKLGLERGLSIALFPMVILTMSIERLAIVWEERGASHCMKVGVGTMFAAVLAYLIMSYQPWVYFVFTFPGTILVLLSCMLLMGHYRGYRITELLRFRDMLRKEES